jgi:glycine/D-amino acid oxidase-like deaminating enzyme
MSIGGIPRPKRVRVGVIGGGVAGLMTAYHVKLRIPNAEVTVLEQGNYIPYQFGTSTRSAACSRQQFGCEHNITMSLYSTRFYERFGSIVGIEDTMFWQRGYLFLYKDDEKWQAAQRRVVIQHDAGLIDVRCLSPEDLAKEFPYRRQ